VINVKAQKNDPVYWTRSNENYNGHKNSSDFQTQLGMVVLSAGGLSDDIAMGDMDRIRQSAQKVKLTISSVKPVIYYGKDFTTWKYSENSMNRYLNKILTSNDISALREAFASFNRVLYSSVKTFGISDEISYYQFCPIAFENKGAFWFSNVKEIRNPYFGTSKLECGSTKKILQ
jgi:Cu(I)/Ag(I) efflux system membrane fusion protein